jgi:hypothetical protein
VMLFFLILVSLTSFPLNVIEADGGFTISVEGKEFRARINKKFPSFLGVLNDAGSPSDPFLGYFYGWWTSSDFLLEGKGWVGLHMPIYKLEKLKIEKGKRSVEVSTDVSLKDEPNIHIRSRYIFYEGVSGFEMEREFIARNGKRFGPLGLWLGGVLSEFPVSNASLPDSYYYQGKWRDKIEHNWQNISSQQKEEGGGAPFVIFYWKATKRYLVSLIDPKGFAGGIRALHFCWRGEWKDPAWWEETGFFSYGKFKARFLIGRGSKKEALKKANELQKGIFPSLSQKMKEETRKGKIEFIKNGFYRLGIDVDRGEVVSLQVDVMGRGEWGANLLAGKRTRIYFGGPSNWQRSVYPSDSYPLYLSPNRTKKWEISSTSLYIPSLLLFSPEREPIISASLTYSLENEKILLKAEFESLRDITLPYLGWHLDFPSNSWKRFYNSAGGYFHIRMLSNYKMSMYDLQPCYRPIGNDMIAYGEDDSLTPFRTIAMELKNEGSDMPFNIHLPNPIFDEPMGISKIAITGSQFDWTIHNCRSMSLKRGKVYRLELSLRIIPPPAPPSQGTFILRFPHSPEIEKAINMFYQEHCYGGPVAPIGIVPFFHILAGKYNPRFSLELTKEKIREYLSALADGETTRDEEGNLLPKGMMPIAKYGDGRWMWRWNGTGYIFEINAQFILSVLGYFILTRDREFIAEVFPKLEEAFGFYKSMADNDVLTLTNPYTGLPNQNRPATYWDGWNIGHRYSLLQVYYVASAGALARLAKALNYDDKANEYKRISEKARKVLFSIYWREKDIRDNDGRLLEGGRFLSWIDVNKKEIDVGFTDIPLLANYLGLLSDEKALKVRLWLDSDPNAYSWKNGKTGKPCGIPSINTIDGNKEVYYAGVWNNFQLPPGFENGQTMFWQGGFDWFLRTKFSLEEVYEMVKSFSERALRGDLASGHGLPHTRPLPMFEGSSTFSANDKPVGSDQGLPEDGVLIAVGIIEGIGGLRLNEEHLYFEPAIPEQLRDFSIENIRIGDVILNIKFSGWGRNVKLVRKNGEPVPHPIPRSLLKTGDLVEVYLDE